jgi:hypothetical protein
LVVALPIFTESAIFTTTVNKAPIVKIEGPFEKEALRILRDIPDIAVEAEARLPDGKRADFLIRAGDVTYVVEVKAQRAVNAAAARQVAEYARQLPGAVPVLVVAETTTEEARRILEETGVAVIDGLGNMRVELPGLFLRAEGRRNAQHARERPPVQLTGKAGVATQALLREPKRKWQVHALANEAAVSAGLAHRVLARLEREQLVEVEGAGPQRTRRVTNPAALLDLWAEEVRDRGVKQLRTFRLARDPRAQAVTLSHALTEANIEHAVTGAAGAARLAPFITAIPVTDIWVAETVGLDDVAAAAGADVVNEGHNIVLRQATGDAPLAFRQEVEKVWTANPFRLFYDLRQDPRRGREQADRLREEVIGF